MIKINYLTDDDLIKLARQIVKELDRRIYGKTSPNTPRTTK